VYFRCRIGLSDVSKSGAGRVVHIRYGLRFACGTRLDPGLTGNPAKFPVAIKHLGYFNLSR